MVGRSEVAHVLRATSSECNHVIDSVSTRVTTYVADIRCVEDASIALLPLASTNSLGHRYLTSGMTQLGHSAMTTHRRTLVR